jgi:hypothetical protein
MKTSQTLALLLCLLSICTNAQEVDSKAALASFLNFVKEAKQDEAAAATFSKPGDKTASSERVQQLIKRSKETQISPVEIVEAKELGTVARVIVKDSAKRPDGKPDYDGILMIKREGVWKIVINANELENTPSLTDAKERKALSELRSWQNEKMSALVAPPKP